MTDFEVHVTDGIDTHQDAHVAAALDQRGRGLGTEAFPATAAGHRQLWRWLNDFGVVDVVVSRGPAHGVLVSPGSSSRSRRQ